MNDNVDWTLLTKYLFGECSEEEAAKIRVWIAEDPTREALLEELRQVRRMTRDTSSSESWDTKALWNRVREQTQRQEAKDKPSSKRQFTGAVDRRARRHARRRPTRQTVVAGVVGLLIAIAAVFWLRGPLGGAATDSALKAKTFATQAGQRASIRLTDGTRVLLNVDSRLTVAPDFGREQRAVRLEGEAFFEVEEDSTRPFTVRAGGAITRVLGTAFDVNAYPENDGAKVVVAEGRVALRSENASTVPGRGKDMVLTKHQMGQILGSGEQVVRKDLDLNRYLAWMDGQLVFEKASFAEVVRSLERWYDLTVTLEEDVAIPPGHLNARFAEDQPLREVLSVIATAFGMEYERSRKRITFTLAEEPHSP